MTAMPEQGRGELAEELAKCPRIGEKELFPFVCAGCGACCRNRRDLLLSGYDLYRLARRLNLPPHIVAHGFCKEEIAEQSCLPQLRLRPDAKTGNCPFFDGNCTVHSARPLACALYPLGQAIDPDTATIEYYLQPPLCGAHVEEATLQNYLDNAGISTRAGTDARWAIVCTQLSEKIQNAGGREHPRFRMAMHRVAKALYYNYTIRDEFYPQFQQNIAELGPLLEKIMSEKAERNERKEA